MKKIVYIIPGYCQSHLKQKGYNKIAKLFEGHGIQTVHVEMQWKKNNPQRFSDYTEQFLRAFKKPKNSKIYILGFSYGATIAFLTAAKTKPNALILCSLSPYFEEDLKDLKQAWVKWFRRNFTQSDYSFTKLAPKIKSKTYLLVGDKEDAACLVRAKDAKRKILNSTLVIAKGAQHNIGQESYLKALKRVISKLGK
ncbi:MAG TPA: alpha/beta hydrolase [Candidatus Paceibacterota bacterium]|nr:alpha/beta hydrolase [Candidatus Paceibacterota bacterium]